MGGLAMSLLGHSRLRWSRPRLVHVRFNSDSDRQPSNRDLALRAMCGRLRVGKENLHVAGLGRCSHVFGLLMRFA